MVWTIIGVVALALLVYWASRPIKSPSSWTTGDGSGARDRRRRHRGGAMPTGVREPRRPGPGHGSAAVGVRPLGPPIGRPPAPVADCTRHRSSKPARKASSVRNDRARDK